MNKITILGNTVTIKAPFKLEDVRTILKHGKKDALFLFDKEMAPTFLISDAEEASFSKFGATFKEENAEGYAIITKTYDNPQSIQDFLEYMAPEFLANLDAVNANINATLAVIKKYKESMKDSVTIL